MTFDIHVQEYFQCSSYSIGDYEYQGTLTVLQLEFNGAAGTNNFIDQSIYKKTPNFIASELTHNTNYWKTGGSSLYMSGSGNTYMTYPHSNDYAFGTGNFTIEFWFRGVQVGFSTIFGQSPTGDNYSPFQLWSTFNAVDGFVSYYVSTPTGSGWAFSGTFGTVPVGTWHHYALVRNGTTISRYRDGSLVSQTTNYTDAFRDSSGDFCIGAYSATNNNPAYRVKGYLDGLKISKGIARYTANFSVANSPILQEVLDALDVISCKHYHEGELFAEAFSSATCSEQSECYKPEDIRYMDEVAVAVDTVIVDKIDSAYVLFLDFEGVPGSSTFTDRSFSKKVATVGGSATITGDSKKRGACSVYFNGTSQYLNYNDSVDWNFGSGDFTVEFWMNTNTVAGSATIIYQSHSTSFQPFKIVRYESAIHLYISTDGTSWNVANAALIGNVSADQWHHIMITRQSTVFKGWFNGVQSINITGISASMLDGSGVLNIGGITSSFFSGYLDELRISKGIARRTSQFFPIEDPVISDIIFANDYIAADLVINGQIQKSVSEYLTISETMSHSHGVCLESFASKTYAEYRWYDRYTVLALEFEGVHGSTVMRDSANKHSFLKHFNTNNVITTPSYISTTADSTKHGPSGWYTGGYGLIKIAQSSDWAFDGDFTIEFWAKSAYSGTASTLFALNHSEYYTVAPIFIYRSQDTIYLYMSSDGFSYNIASLNLGAYQRDSKWYHCMITRQGNTIRGFMNGVLKATATSSLKPYRGTKELNIGAYSGYSPSYMDSLKVSIGTARKTANFNPLDDITLYRDSAIANDALGILVTIPGGSSRRTEDVYEDLSIEDSIESFRSVVVSLDPPSLLEDNLVKDYINVDHWPSTTSLALDFEGGSITDPRGKVITASGTARLSTADKKFGNSSLLIDGAGGYLEVTNSPDFNFGTESFTVDLWFKPLAVDTYNRTLIKFGNSGTIPIHIYITAVQDTAATYSYSDQNGYMVWFSVFNSAGSSKIYNRYAVPDMCLAPRIRADNNAWHHLAITRYADSSQGTTTAIRCYIDGEEVYNAGSYAENIANSPGNIYIGGIPAASAPFIGYIDRVRILKGVSTYKSISGSRPWITGYPPLDFTLIESAFTSDAISRVGSSLGFTVLEDQSVITDEIEQIKYKNAASEDNSAAVSDEIAGEVNWFYFLVEESSITDAEAILVGEAYFRETEGDSSSATDTVVTESNLTLPISEEFTIGEVTDGGIFRIAPELTESASSEALAYGVFNRSGSVNESNFSDAVALGVKDIFRESTDNTSTVSDAILLTNKTGLSSTFENTIFHSIFNYQRILNDVGYIEMYLSQNVINNFAYPIFMARTFSGSALAVTNSLKEIIHLPAYFTFSLRDHQRIDLYQKFWNNLESNIEIINGEVRSPKALSYEYKVTLDEKDVTDKISSGSIKISYGIDKFCAEIDITWADYTIFEDVDCSNVVANYVTPQERIAVYTKLVNQTDWVCQGKFFLEKRGIAVVYDKIGVTSWGRNRPALLALPFSKPITKTWDNDTTALAIAQEVVALVQQQTGQLVTLRWDVGYDYKILGGNLSVESLSAVDIIAMLAKPIGAVLTTNKVGDLRVMYRYQDI